MRCFAASATAISTPASAYFMKVLLAFVYRTRAPGFLSFSFGRSFCATGWVRRHLFVLLGTLSLKSPEQSLPAHQTRMNQRVRVGKEALANLPGLPGVGRDVERHIYHYRRADNIFAWNAAPEAAVVRIAAIVAHHEITVVRNFVRLPQIVRIAAANCVAFVQPLTVHPHRTIVDINGISRQADNALHVVRGIRREGWFENDDLLAMRIAPQRHMPIREGHARVVADAAHDQVIADQQRVLHRSRRNHARLADRAVDEQKNQRYPEPRDDFALYSLSHGHAGLRFFAALGIIFHVQ